MGIAILCVTGQLVGMLPSSESVEAAVFAEWVHRSINVDPLLLHPGSKYVSIVLQGAMHLDRTADAVVLLKPPPGASAACEFLCLTVADA